MNIQTSVEKQRGCGYRKKGGMYLMGGNLGSTCCKLPYELTVCPHCSSGIKPSRGWTWITTSLFNPPPCEMKIQEVMNLKGHCPLSEPNLRVGLLWIGGSYYKTLEDFLKEARNQGISRRISQLPRDFKLGETWVALGHRDCIPYSEAVVSANAVDAQLSGKSVIKYKPGIFQMFKPYRMDYVVKGDETTEELERYEKRGFTLVDVIPDKQVVTANTESDE